MAKKERWINQTRVSDGDDYVTLMHDMSSRYANAVYTNFEYYLKVYGTDVVVSRASEEDEFKKSLGSAYIFDGNYLDTGVEKFTERIIISRSELLSRYRTSENELSFYTNKDVFKMGDQIQFKLPTHNIKYKVNNIESFDPHGLVMLYRVEIMGFEEYKKSKNK